MKRTKCSCGSENTTIKYGVPCDFGYVVCLDCGKTGKSGESRKEIENGWEENLNIK